jgi:hypothetical protein
VKYIKNKIMSNYRLALPLLDASNAATRAVGSIMGVMPNRVVDVPLVAAQG